ncbi:hypothetical protein SAMN05443549_101622 [Flavobacterium fluvii]|uniref:Uncharacterized protein n=1 Tax=Flavobacterium fluvii TaxID=468056 RepID=A0A1M5F4P6_9FLAO|nr:hypothetical protein SAMN05443549_101622 [Flavobacterium fluvii]
MFFINSNPKNTVIIYFKDNLMILSETILFYQFYIILLHIKNAK